MSAISAEMKIYVVSRGGRDKYMQSLIIAMIETLLDPIITIPLSLLTTSNMQFRKIPQTLGQSRREAEGKSALKHHSSFFSSIVKPIFLFSKKQTQLNNNNNLIIKTKRKKSKPKSRVLRKTIRGRG